MPERILLVKTSSMGDIIHNLPVVTDIHAHLSGAMIDWVVEESFSAIPAMHPRVRRVFPVALRRWRKNLTRRSVIEELRAFRSLIRAETYDIVIDTQGLFKSALVASIAKGTRCGYDWQSAREPVSSLFYQKTIGVSRQQHAVERNRLLAARCLGYDIDQPADYGIRTPESSPSWLPSRPYAVLLHATSRDDKLWPERNWVELGRQLNTRGVQCVLPWGGKEEAQRSQRISSVIDDAFVPPRSELRDLAALLGGARAVAGVDTGLTHLAAALGTPVIGIYCATDPGFTGVYAGHRAVNLGGAGRPPSPEDVLAAIREVELND